MKNKSKTQKGITLVALIITIIVLLILVGVSIATLTGENGILTQANRAKEENKKAEIIEQIRLDISIKQIENKGSINEDKFYDILEKYGTISADKTKLTTTKENYEILISDIYDGNLADSSIDYTINVSSNTVDLHWDKNILSFSKNDKTENYNIVWINEKSVDFSQIRATGGAAGQFVIGGTEDEYLSINLQGSSFLQTWKGNLKERQVVSKIITDSPTVQGVPLERMKISKTDDGDVNISYKNNGEWINYCTIESSKIKGYISGDVRLGFIVNADNTIEEQNNVKYVIYNDSYDSIEVFDKKIAFLGDSITTNLQYNYSELLKRWLGFTKYGYGLGGSPISGNTTNSFVDRFTKPESEYYTEIDKDVDVIFLFGGHNDGANNVGTIDDTTQETFYGSLKILIEYFQSNYPNAKIIFATPIKRNNESVNLVLEKKAEAMKTICNSYDIECIDLYSNSGITYDNSSTYLGDGIHPNEEGNKLIAEYLYKIFRKIKF